MLVNVFYRKDFGRVDPCDVREDDYDYVCDLWAPDESPGLEYTFREMNAVDGTETCCRLRLRSMSVGDVAVLPGGVFLCCPVGWEQIVHGAVDEFLKRVDAGDFA